MSYATTRMLGLDGTHPRIPTWRFMGSRHGVMSRLTVNITHIGGLITILTITHDPPNSPKPNGSWGKSERLLSRLGRAWVLVVDWLGVGPPVPFPLSLPPPLQLHS